MNTSELSTTLEETLAIFTRKDEPLATPEVADQLDLGRRATYSRLERLVESGYLETKKVGASARVWWKASEFRPAPTSFTPETNVSEDDEDAINSGDQLPSPSIETTDENTLEGDFDEIFARIDEGFFTTNDDWQVTYINDQAARLLDVSTSETLQSRLWDVCPDLSTGESKDEIEEAVESQESVVFESKFDTLDFWAELRVYPSESGFSAFIRDISNRKEREAELDRAFDLLHTAKETADVGGWEMDPETKELYWTEHLFDILTVEQDEEPTLEHRLESYHDEDRAELEKAVDKALEDGEVIDVEARFYTSDDEMRWVHIQGNPEREDEEVVSYRGALQDITDRKNREQVLERRARQQAVVAQLGKEALENRNLDELMAKSSKLVADALDNEYCKVLDLDTEADELLLRQGVGWEDGIVGDATVSSVEDDSQAAYTLATETPVVVENLETETRFSGPDLLTDHGVKSGISVIIGPPDDPWGIIGTHDTAQKSFTEEDVSFVLSVANILASAIERHHDEHQIHRHRRELATLNNLNAIVHNTASTIIGKSTREQIEQAACNVLATSQLYESALIAGIDSKNERLEPRAIACMDDNIGELLNPTGSDDSGRNNPGMTALHTHETQVIPDVFSDSKFEAWRDAATEYGFTSFASIPIIHEETVYGVLVVYADRDNAFNPAEETVISRLGEVIGHTIASIERKHALMSDEVVELTFKVSDIYEELEISAEPHGSITATEMVPRGNEEFLIYGVVTEGARESMKILEQSLSRWEAVTFYDDEGDTRFEIQLSQHPVFSSLASLGGSLEKAVLEDGDYTLTVHVAPNVEVRNFIDCIKETYPGVEMVIRHQKSRDGENRIVDSSDIIESLTERQQATLVAAYHSGYFEWPRNSTGEDVADALGIAPPTFHNHLRKAQQRVIESIVAARD